ncbi:hypothetical protein VFPPC_08565 [Pochonia chlamydosporia 170]|uniref:Secreted protein n=1 Tax=Pochonia chlamydosporia 170 TaxID=1380566 RepID=A0A179FPA7_METCM|nr:hypothetical protein VFPPC_08565 [Pochonia chlamydosporia 170]OAQ67118.2 hypothetical protein VFPPC_08565 [Pochonia chlamydosporia 170]
MVKPNWDIFNGAAVPLFAVLLQNVILLPACASNGKCCRRKHASCDIWLNCSCLPVFRFINLARQLHRGIANSRAWCCMGNEEGAPRFSPGLDSMTSHHGNGANNRETKAVGSSGKVSGLWGFWHSGLDRIGPHRGRCPSTAGLWSTPHITKLACTRTRGRATVNSTSFIRNTIASAGDFNRTSSVQSVIWTSVEVSLFSAMACTKLSEQARPSPKHRLTDLELFNATSFCWPPSSSSIASSILNGANRKRCRRPPVSSSRAAAAHTKEQRHGRRNQNKILIDPRQATCSIARLILVGAFTAQ